jgi:hypothetical protein
LEYCVGCSLALDVDKDAPIEDDDKAVADVDALSDVESSTAKVEDDLVVELEVAADVSTGSKVVVDVELTTVDDEDDVIVEFEPLANTDADAVAEDEDELVPELETVSDEAKELEAVASMALARRVPSTELLELDTERMLEELEVLEVLKVGWLDSEDEL